MQQFWYLIPALACPVGMGLMMWVMMRGSRGDKGQPPADPWHPRFEHDDLGALTPDERLAVLQQRQRRLDAEVKALQENDTHPSRN